MKSLLTRLIFAGFLISGSAAVHAQTTINFTSPAFEVGKDSTGTELTSSYTFALGSFGSFTPEASNIDTWDANFTALGSVTWDEVLTQYSGSANVLNNNAPFTTSDQGFVWGFNTKVIDTTTEWVLITNPAWLFPTSGSVPTVDWTSNDGGTYAALGILSATQGSDPYIQTANLASAVPEPSTYALIAGAACLGFMMVRRRFIKA